MSFSGLSNGGGSLSVFCPFMSFSGLSNGGGSLSVFCPFMSFSGLSNGGGSLSVFCVLSCLSQACLMEEAVCQYFVSFHVFLRPV